MNKITYQDVKELLKKVGEGKIVPTLVDPSKTWESVYAGEIEFNVGDWMVRVFNDCDFFDYVDGVRAPDGRTAEFEDFRCSHCETMMYPDNLLYQEDENIHKQMVGAFKSAK